MNKILVWFAGLVADEIKKRLLADDVKLSILNLQPGDRVILRSRRRVSDSAYEHLKQSVEELFPGHRVVILEEGLEIFVARDKENKIEVRHDD